MTDVFPIIRHIDDLAPHIEGKDAIIRIEKGDYVVFDYVYVTPETFTNPFARECRGIKFNRQGKIIARPFHKFFNLNEVEDTRFENLDWDSPWFVMNKLDGSMIHPVLLGSQLVLMTRKGYSDVAQQAEHECLTRTLEMEMRDYLDRGITPIYEYTSPRNQIVLRYDEPQLTLLALRDTVTGQYIDDASCFDQKEDPASLVKKSKELIDKEGYVLRWSNGHMIKLKADEYVRLHRSIDSTAHEKRLIEVILNKNLDDLLPLLPENRREKVENYARRFNNFISNLTVELIYLNEMTRDLSQKEFALMVLERIEKRKQPFAFKARAVGQDNTLYNIREIVEETMKQKLTSQAKIDEWRDLIGEYDAHEV